jgi:modulator of FtsH protease
MPTYEQLGFGRGAALTGDRARTVFGHVMGLVAFTLGFAALGAWITRNAQGGFGIFSFLIVLGVMFGMQGAAARGRERLAVGLLFALGLLLGMAVGPVLSYYAHANPGAVYQAAGTTGLGVAALGAFGYTTRRDLSGAARIASTVLLGALIFLLIALLVSIPVNNVVWSVVLLGVFAVLTAFDFQRLAQSGNYQNAPLIAASIFLDVFNIFLLLLSLFGGGGNRR